MGLWQDLRYAIRLLIKDGWLTLVAVSALALGIGVNSTVFTLVNAVLIRGLPIENPDRVLAVVGRNVARNMDTGASYPDFDDWRASTRTFSGLAAFTGGTFNVSDEGRPPERYPGPYISANAFRLIGQQPLLGRDFRPEDDRPGAPPVVILGNGIWKSRYGGDPAILGRTIKVNEVPSTVIGVMAEGLKFPIAAELWQPFALTPGFGTLRRDVRNLQVFGRLTDGRTLAEAQAEFTTLATRLARDHPDTNKDSRTSVMVFNQRHTGGNIRLVFLCLLGAVGFVLLIACANVANLLLARSAQRAREIAVRVALGATRLRIVRQLLIESVVLAVISGVFGLALSIVGIRLFAAEVNALTGVPYWIKFTMDARVFGFLAAVCLSTAVIFGLAPALHISKTDVNEVLKEGGRSGAGGLRTRRWVSALIVAELALTLVLLAGAGFMIHSFVAVYGMDIGVDTSRLLTMSLVLPDRRYPTPEQRAGFYQRLDERLRGVAGIQSSTISSNPPLGGGFTYQLAIEGRAPVPGERPPTVTMVTAGVRYFDTIGVHSVRGRAFADGDGLPGQEHAIVNQRFVAMHFGTEDPIGRRIKLTPDVPAAGVAAPAWVSIAGVVPNVRQRSFAQPDPDPVVYLPYRARPDRFMMLLARGQGGPGALTATIREEVRAIDPDLPLFRIQTLDRLLAEQRWYLRVFGSMFGIFALIALMLSAVGLYAVTAYSVTQRTQEIGVRMALGAQPQQVWWLIFRRVFVQMTIGLIIGMAGAFAVGRLLRSLLAQTSPTDPTTLVSIAVLFAAVSVVAGYWPARRATRLDPLVALRYE